MYFGGYVQSLAADKYREEEVREEEEEEIREACMTATTDDTSPMSGDRRYFWIVMCSLLNKICYNIKT